MTAGTLCHSSETGFLGSRHRPVRFCGHRAAHFCWNRPFGNAPFVVKFLTHLMVGTRGSAGKTTPSSEEHGASSIREASHWLTSFGTRNAKTTMATKDSDDQQQRRSPDVLSSVGSANLTNASDSLHFFLSGNSNGVSSSSQLMQPSSATRGTTRAGPAAKSVHRLVGKGDAHLQRPVSQSESTTLGTCPANEQLGQGADSVTGKEAATVPQSSGSETVQPLALPPLTPNKEKKVSFGSALEVTIYYYETESPRRSHFWTSVRNAIHFRRRGRTVHPRVSGNLRPQAGCSKGRAVFESCSAKTCSPSLHHVFSETRVVPLTQLEGNQEKTMLPPGNSVPGNGASTVKNLCNARNKLNEASSRLCRLEGRHLNTQASWASGPWGTANGKSTASTPRRPRHWQANIPPPYTRPNRASSVPVRR